MKKDIKGDSAGDKVTVQNCPLFTRVLSHRNRLDAHLKGLSPGALWERSHPGSSSYKNVALSPSFLPPFLPSFFPLFLLSTLTMAAGYTEANKTDKISALVDLQSRGQADIKQANKKATLINTYLQKETKCWEDIQGAMQRTNRVDLIWELRGGFLEEVI